MGGHLSPYKGYLFHTLLASCGFVGVNDSYRWGYSSFQRALGMGGNGHGPYRCGGGGMGMAGR